VVGSSEHGNETLGSHKIPVISSVGDELLASQGLRSVEWFNCFSRAEHWARPISSWMKTSPEGKGDRNVKLTTLLRMSGTSFALIKWWWNGEAVKLLLQFPVMCEKSVSWSTIFDHVTPCSLSELCWFFGATYYLHLRNRIVSRKKRTAKCACLSYSAALKMETLWSSETSIHFYQTTRRFIADNSRIHFKSVFVYDSKRRKSPSVLRQKSNLSLLYASPKIQNCLLFKRPCWFTEVWKNAP
jgi:hypothetical protein